MAYRTAAIHDLDGSVGGIPNSYVLINDGENDSVATDDSCEIRPTWNAAVCTGDLGRLNFRAAQITSAAPAAGALRGGFGFGYVRPAPRPAGAAPATPPAPQAPIALVRNGKEFHITANQSTVRAGTEIRVLTRRDEVSFSVSEMDQGSWLVSELPGFTNADSESEVGSMEALRAANETSSGAGMHSGSNWWWPSR